MLPFLVAIRYYKFRASIAVIARTRLVRLRVGLAGQCRPDRHKPVDPRPGPNMDYLSLGWKSWSVKRL